MPCLPLVYTEIKANTPGGPFHNQRSALATSSPRAPGRGICNNGTWPWAAGVWAPTGDFDVHNPTLAGKGYWTEMLTAGATWYPDQEKRWALSVLNRYEFSQEQSDTDITPGQAYTVEGGLSYGVTKDH